MAQEDRENIAAEYVLGTLDADERRAVSARRNVDPALDAEITGWEQRLSPMLSEVSPASPRAELFKDVVSRIDSDQILPKAAILSLKRQVSVWKTATVGAAAIAASICAFIVGTGNLTTQMAPLKGQSFVGVFQDNDKLPRFVMSINLEKRELTIRPVDAALPEGKTYQLWIKQDELGPRPKSLGLLASKEQPTRKELAQFTPALLKQATFGISIEPEGGSVTGQPSAGALHSKLIPAVF